MIDILISVAAVLAWMVACMAGLALVWRLMEAKPREHDPRMNVPQMVATVWSRWLDHKEWKAHHDSSANTVAQVQPVQLAEPVKRGLLPEPEYIDGEIVYSEAQRRAVVRFAQSRSVEVFRENK
jgi:hypothetical protein